MLGKYVEWSIEKKLLWILNFMMLVSIFQIQTLKIQDYDNNNFYKFKEPVLKDS